MSETFWNLDPREFRLFFPGMSKGLTANIIVIPTDRVFDGNWSIITNSVVNKVMQFHLVNDIELYNGIDGVFGKIPSIMYNGETLEFYFDLTFFNKNGNITHKLLCQIDYSNNIITGAIEGFPISFKRFAQ